MMRSISGFLLFSVDFITRTHIALSLPQSAFANYHEGLHLSSKRGFFDAESTAKEVAEAKKLLRPPKRLNLNTLEGPQSQQIQHAGKNANGESLSTTADPKTTQNVESFITKGHTKSPKVHDDSGTVMEADVMKLFDGKAHLSVKIPHDKKLIFNQAFVQHPRLSTEQKSMKNCFPVFKGSCTSTGVFSGFKKFASKSSKWLRPKSDEVKHVGLLSPLPKRLRPLETPPEDGPYYSSTMLSVDHGNIRRAKTI